MGEIWYKRCPKTFIKLLWVSWKLVGWKPYCFERCQWISVWTSFVSVLFGWNLV